MFNFFKKKDENSVSGNIKENTHDNSVSKNSFDTLKDALSKTSSALVKSVLDIAGTNNEIIDEFELEDIESMLIKADLGVEFALEIISAIKERKVKSSELKTFLKEEFSSILASAGSNKLLFDKDKLNIYFITGVNGAGKTTLLNILSSFIGENERIVTIEDAAELTLHQNHVISLETRNANYEGEGEVTIRDLVINSLRMRPDRIVVGEVRGKEAFDMLQAMNTGHEGSITTMHANSPHDALNRLETMILMAGMEIPVRAIREYIEEAIDIVVQIERLSDGHRRVTSICEVTGITGGTVNLKEVFAFHKQGLTESLEVKGEFVLEPYVPVVYDKMKAMGISDLEDIFGE